MLALLTAVIVSPLEARTVSEMADFDHPESLPDQASERAEEALDARGTHGGGQDDNDDIDSNDNAAEVDNDHDVNPGESVSIDQSVENGIVDLDIEIDLSPREGVEKGMDLDVDAPGNDKELPVGPPGDVPRGPPDDVPRGDGNGD